MAYEVKAKLSQVIKSSVKILMPILKLFFRRKVTILSQNTAMYHLSQKVA
jgi:hypothetical protein